MCVLQVEKKIDTSGLVCPHPLLKAKRALGGLSIGQVLEVVATDPASVIDFGVFARQGGHTLLKCAKVGLAYQFFLQKGSRQADD